MRGPELGCQGVVMLSRITACAGGDLGRQQTHNQAVFVGCPDAAITAKKAGPRTLLPAETTRTVEQALDEPPEAYRHFQKPMAEPLDDAVDQAARYHRLADHGLQPPIRAVRKQIADGNRQVMVGVQ